MLCMQIKSHLQCQFQSIGSPHAREGRSGTELCPHVPWEQSRVIHVYERGDAPLKHDVPPGAVDQLTLRQVPLPFQKDSLVLAKRRLKHPRCLATIMLSHSPPPIVSTRWHAV